MSRVILEDGRTINVTRADLVEIDTKAAKRKKTREEVAAEMFPAPKQTKAEKKAAAAASAEEPAPSATGKES